MVLYKFIVDETRCMNCGACMDLCPSTCLEFTRPDDLEFYGSLMGASEPKPLFMEKPYLISEERCTGCQICVRECPTGAIALEVDTSKPLTARPRPVIIKRERAPLDGYWHPLSEYTQEFLKRPVSSMWSSVADWKPMTKERGTGQVWRTMPEPEKPQKRAPKPQKIEETVRN